MTIGGGQIFKGTYMGTEIAAKRVMNGLSRSAAADFEQEVSMLNRLQHPCVLSFFGVTENTAGDMFMVIEAC